MLMNAGWEGLRNVFTQRETVGFPFTTDAEKKEKYTAAVASLREMQDAGYVDFDADDVDSLETLHLITMRWKADDADLSEREVQKLIDLLDMSEDGVYFTEQGKVWVIGVTIYHSNTTELRGE